MRAKTIEEYIESRPRSLRRLWNPSKEQLEKLSEILSLHPLEGQRPSFEDYVRAEKRLSKSSRVKSLKGIRIQNVSEGLGPREVKPQKTFDAKFDLEEGLALTSCLDSGGNHMVMMADRCIWTQIWNYNAWRTPA